MSNIVLIESLAPRDANLVSESRDGGQNHYMQGCFMVGDVVNGNMRSYPTSEISRAVTESMNRIQQRTHNLWRVKSPK